MKQTINKYQFREAFLNLRPENFSLVGLDVLFQHLEQMEQDLGEELELDVIAICCDYSEASWQDIARDYSVDLRNCSTDEEKQETVSEYLSENTYLVGETYSGAFLYQNF